MYGGGAGCGAGGGSSYISGLNMAFTTTGGRQGNGQITFTWTEISCGCANINIQIDQDGFFNANLAMVVVPDDPCATRAGLDIQIKDANGNIIPNKCIDMRSCGYRNGRGF